MRALTKATAAIMLMTVVMMAAGCTKPDDPNNPNSGGNGGNGGGSTPTTEGIYLGIIGFNNGIIEPIKEISLLNTSTKNQFLNYIDNLQKGRLTGLYYADYVGLEKLKAYQEPPKLKTVSMVTFTDGLDNYSTQEGPTNPNNYDNPDDYRDYLNNRITTEQFHGLPMTAYSVGLKGSDITENNIPRFRTVLEKLASPGKSYMAENMAQVNQQFQIIAQELSHTYNFSNISLAVPPAYYPNEQIRFTFDLEESATSPATSNLYITATYEKTSNSRVLRNISYHGFKNNVSSNESFEKDADGFFVFKFANLRYSNDEAVTSSDLSRVRLWHKPSDGDWTPESEFIPGQSTSTEVDKNSALIMLVLDCTDSMGDDFIDMKTHAKNFVNTLVSSQTPTYTVSVSANPSNGGSVTGGGTYEEGQSCTVNATAATGYNFLKWTENGSQVSTNANYTFTVTSNHSLVAHFAAQPQAPTGAINGVFSVSASQRVYFSQGNLQYKASTAQWRFATNQYDYIGSANSNISSSYSGWIDLFGWGTSGWNCGNTYYRPWDSNNSNGSGSLYGPPGQYNLTGSYANSDWGYYNAISNGGNATHQWRTLTQSEWNYVFNTRSTSSGIRYAKAQVAGVNGVILIPDDWSTSYYSLSNTNSSGASFSSNVISSSNWTNSLQSHGAVFLPAAGFRKGTSVYFVGSDGGYWSASYSYNSYLAYDVYFYDGYLVTDYRDNRYYGFSVRLVCPAE